MSFLVCEFYLNKAAKIHTQIKTTGSPECKFSEGKDFVLLNGGNKWIHQNLTLESFTIYNLLVGIFSASCRLKLKALTSDFFYILLLQHNSG